MRQAESPRPGLLNDDLSGVGSERPRRNPSPAKSRETGFSATGFSPRPQPDKRTSFLGTDINSGLICGEQTERRIVDIGDWKHRRTQEEIVRAQINELRINSGDPQYGFYLPAGSAARRDTGFRC